MSIIITEADIRAIATNPTDVIVAGIVDNQRVHRTGRNRHAAAPVLLHGPAGARERAFQADARVRFRRRLRGPQGSGKHQGRRRHALPGQGPDPDDGAGELPRSDAGHPEARAQRAGFRGGPGPARGISLGAARRRLLLAAPEHQSACGPRRPGGGDARDQRRHQRAGGPPELSGQDQADLDGRGARGGSRPHPAPRRPGQRGAGPAERAGRSRLPYPGGRRFWQVHRRTRSRSSSGSSASRPMARSVR